MAELKLKSFRRIKIADTIKMLGSHVYQFLCISKAKYIYCVFWFVFVDRFTNSVHRFEKIEVMFLLVFEFVFENLIYVFAQRRPRLSDFSYPIFFTLK